MLRFRNTILLHCLIVIGLLSHGINASNDPIVSENEVFSALRQENMTSIAYESLNWSANTWEEAVAKWIEVCQKPFLYDRKYSAYKAFEYGITELKTTIDRSTINTWQDLNLFAGKNPGDRYVATSIAQPQTEVGVIALCDLIAVPTTDTQSISQRQASIKALIEKKAFRESLEVALARFSKAEYVSNTMFNDGDFSSHLVDRNTELPFPLNFIPEVNKNPYALAGAIGVDVTTLMYAMYVETIAGGILAYAAAKNLGLPGSLINTDPYQINYEVKPRLSYLSFLWDMLISKEDDGTEYRKTKAIIQALCSAIAFNTAYRQARYLKSMRAAFLGVHFALMNLTKTIQALHILHKCLKELPELAVLQEFDALFDLYDPKHKAYDNYQHLLALSYSETFATESPTSAHMIGRSASAYAYFKDIKKDISKAIACLGYADAFCSLARQIDTTSQAEGPRFCFAELKESAQPEITIRGAWHPVIERNKAVTNNIDLNCNGARRNIIVTGPNAGGKSTALKSIALTVWLAQTIGVVPAESCVLTPFKNISTYLNVTDNIAGGQSLFKAEVMRTQELIKTIEEEKSAHHFVVFDEVFNGTSPKEGTAAAYAVAEYLSTLPNSICLIATHFDKLTELEAKTTSFTNYKVEVDENQQEQSILYKFKLEPGIATQHVALKIIENEGYNSTLVTRAHEVLKTL